MNLTWLCTNASRNLLRNLLQNPVEPDLALHQSLPRLHRNLLRSPVEPDLALHQSRPGTFGTFSGTLLNLTWLCTKASRNLLRNLFRNPVEPNLALHQSLTHLLGNLLRNLTWLCTKADPEPSEPFPEPAPKPPGTFSGTFSGTLLACLLACWLAGLLCLALPCLALPCLALLACLLPCCLAATGPSHLFLRAFKTAVCPPSNPSKPLKPFRRPFQGNSRSFPRAFPWQLSQLHAPHNASNPYAGLSKATVFFARLQTHQTPQTLPQAFPRQHLQLPAAFQATLGYKSL